METSLQNYFWLVDRLAMEDDARNKVNAESDTVTLSEDLRQALVSGDLVERLLTEMQRTYTMRTGQSFQLEPYTSSMLATAAAHGVNDGQVDGGKWDHLNSQLRLFGLGLTESKVEKIKQGDVTVVASLITALYETDTSPPTGSATSGLPDGGSSDEPSSLGAPSTSRNKAGGKGSISQIVLEPLDHQHHLQRQQSKLSKGQTNYTIVALNEVSDPNTVPIPSVSPRLAQQPGDKTLTSHKKRNSRTVRNRGTRQSADFLDLPERLDETLTSAQFVMRSLMTAFGMTSTQVAGLLSDNHRYLYHLCVKGLKGGEFDQVRDWYDLVALNAAHLVSLLEMELQNQAEAQKNPQPVSRMARKASLASSKYQVSTTPLTPTKTLLKTLNILKGGLYSRDTAVTHSCLTLFNAVVAELNLCGGDIASQTWDWLTKPTEIVPEDAKPVDVGTSVGSLGNNRRQSQLRQPSQVGSKLSSLKSPPQPNSKLPAKGSASPKRGAKKARQSIDQGSQLSANESEFTEMLRQMGLQGVIHAFNSSESLHDVGAFVLLQFGKFNGVELFTDKLLALVGNWTEYSQICESIFTKTVGSDLAAEVLEMQGVLSFWVHQSLKVAESSGEVTLDDRIRSLVLLTEVWLHRTDYIDVTMEGSGAATINILKRAARDIKQTLAIVAIELMFRLLEQFARKKHPTAPLIYKTLTFILVEFYWEVDIRDLMLRHFIYLFKKLDKIPVAILCEPLLKQVQISQYHATSFNVFDFEFFQVVAYHKKLNVQTCLLLMDALTKIALSSVFYARVALQTVRAMIMRFSKSPEMLTHWKEQFRQMVQSLTSIEATLTQHDLAAKEDKDNFFNRLAMQNRGRRKTRTIRGQSVSAEFRLTEAEAIAVKTNQRLLVNVLSKLIQLGNELLNEELRQLLIDAFIACEKQMEVRSKAITYLLQQYGVDVNAMVSHKIEAQVLSQEDQEAILIRQSETSGAAEEGLGPQEQVLQRTRSRSASKSPVRQSGQSVIPQLAQVKTRQVETANTEKSPPFKKSESQRKVGKGSKAGGKLSPRVGNYAISSVRRSQSNAQSHSMVVTKLALYEYQTLESATDLLRYRHFIKRHTKLYREIFARYEGNATKTSRVPKSQQTFDNQKNLSKVISATNLLKMIKDFDLMPNQGSADFVSALKLRRDVPSLIKLINQLPECTLETKLPELSYSGFVEFMLQFAHQIYNNEAYEKPLVAAELVDKLLLKTLRRANEEKRLMLSLKHFSATAAGQSLVRPEDRDLLNLLNEKIQEDPDYALPDGYKVVQEVEIADSYQVPDVLEMAEGDKICLELLDEVVSKAFNGLHILKSVPQTTVKSRVVVDESRVLMQAASRNLRGQSHGSVLSTTEAAQYLNNASLAPALRKQISRVSQGSSASKSMPMSPNIKEQYLSTPQLLAAKGKLLESSFARQPIQQPLRPELKLAVMKAPADDKAHVAECASALEEILQAVESQEGPQAQNLQAFSLVANQAKVPLFEGQGSASKRNLGSNPLRFSANQLSLDGQSSLGGATRQPRYLSKYVSKRTLARQQEIEEEKAKKEKPLSANQRKERAMKVRESIAKHDQYLERQKKKAEEAKEEKRRELEKTEQAKARALKHRKAQQDRVKAQLKEFNEKKEKEMHDKIKQEDEQKKARQKEANELMKKKNEAMADELQKLRQAVVSKQEEKKKAVEAQGQLPKVDRKVNHDFVKRDKPQVPGQDNNSGASDSVKAKKPPVPVKTARDTSRPKPAANARNTAAEAATSKTRVTVPRVPSTQRTLTSVTAKKSTSSPPKKQSTSVSATTLKKPPTAKSAAKPDPQKARAAPEELKNQSTLGLDSLKVKDPTPLQTEVAEESISKPILTEESKTQQLNKSQKSQGKPSEAANAAADGPMPTDNYSQEGFD